MAENEQHVCRTSYVLNKSCLAAHVLYTPHPEMAKQDMGTHGHCRFSFVKKILSLSTCGLRADVIFWPLQIYLSDILHFFYINYASTKLNLSLLNLSLKYILSDFLNTIWLLIGSHKLIISMSCSQGRGAGKESWNCQPPPDPGVGPQRCWRAPTEQPETRFCRWDTRR